MTENSVAAQAKEKRLPGRLGRVCAAIAVGASLLMAIPTPAPAQSAPAVYQVELGEFTEGVEAEVLRTFPSALRVHPGDILHFTNETGALPETGVHLAALLPTTVGPDEWFSEQGRVPSAPWAWLVSDPDEMPQHAPSALKGNNRNIFPSDPQCGQSQSNPCPFDGSGDPVEGVLSSGIGWGIESSLDFWVEVTAPPGTTLWAVCPFHTTLRTRIDVVAADEPASDPAALEQQRQAELQHATAQAKALHERLRNRRVGRERRNGTTVWRAWAGPEIKDIFLVGMYPRKLVVKEDDAVRWNLEPLRTEGHTVTFPIDEALTVHNSWFEFKCDLDGDSGTQDDSEAAPLPPFCPGGPLQVEQDINHAFPFPRGDGEYVGGRDFETSGLKGPWAGVSNSAVNIRFPHRSGAEGYSYACMLHPTMRAKVVVK